MAKKKVDNNWLLIRESTVPASERQIERDDPLFAKLQKLFQSEQIQFDFEELAKETGYTPEDVFMNIHENYGYVCIGTGENPTIPEKLTEKEKALRQDQIEKALIAAKLPHILIKGKYLGVEENSYFIPFNYKTISLPKVLQSDVIKKVEAIATQHKQDSLLICQSGYSCYLYTHGAQKGKVITGRTAVVYPAKQQLPSDCYSLFFNKKQQPSVGFTCGLDFNRIYESITEFAEEENNKLQTYYRDFFSYYANLQKNSQKIVILLRGTDGYNHYAVNLKQSLALAGVNAEIFGTDANIAQINQEISKAQKEHGPMEHWQWPQIRDAAIKRNQLIYDYLLNNPLVDVIIYSDMNKEVEFLRSYVNKAMKKDYKVISHVVNSFVFEPNRAEMSKRLSDEHGIFMARHLADFKSNKGQITATELTFSDYKIKQEHSLPISVLTNRIVQSLQTQHELNKQNTRDAVSITAMQSNLMYKKVKPEDALTQPEMKTPILKIK